MGVRESERGIGLGWVGLAFVVVWGVRWGVLRVRGGERGKFPKEQICGTRG